ncbi:MAG: NAD-dependent epimerase/dehydratase family protein [Candidatus Limnocylindrales bacterium]
MTETSTPAHVVLGAGPVGATIARQLAVAGQAVRVVTRSGRDLGVAGVTPFSADITDPAAVRAATAGAHTVYFAAQPAYSNWPKGFPPIVEGVLGGLRGSGIRLAVIDNLYAYGPTHGGPIREDLPYAATNRKGTARAGVAEAFMAAHAAGEVRVTIARASDFFGPEVIDSLVGQRFFAPILAGKSVQLLGDPDAPHSVTYVPDFARTLIELAGHEEAFGEAWHVSSVPAVSLRQFAELVSASAGTGSPRISRVSRLMLRFAGVFSAPAREMVEMLYEFEEPYLLDSSKAERAFGLTATPFEESIPATWPGGSDTGRRPRRIPPLASMAPWPAGSESWVAGGGRSAS